MNKNPLSNRTHKHEHTCPSSFENAAFIASLTCSERARICSCCKTLSMATVQMHRQKQTRIHPYIIYIYIYTILKSPAKLLYDTQASLIRTDDALSLMHHSLKRYGWSQLSGLSVIWTIRKLVTNHFLWKKNSPEYYSLKRAVLLRFFWL